ncbi:hypothetical protein ACFL4Z_03675 [candidate division KSB1 bacterium]
MVTLKFYRLFLIIILSVFFSYLFYCTSQNPLDVSEDIINNSNNSKGSLTKLPKSRMYISSRADLKVMFKHPGNNWRMRDLTEGGTVIFLYSPNSLLSSPAEDLLPRFVIVEMTHKIDNGPIVEAHWRGEKLKEKYGDENVEILKIEDDIIGGRLCTHFSYKVNYPVSGKIGITDEYGFYHNHYYYIVQFSKPVVNDIIQFSKPAVNDVIDENVDETFKEIKNSLKINKTLTL